MSRHNAVLHHSIWCGVVSDLEGEQVIHTLVSSGMLYRINRHRGALMLEREKRRTFLLCCGITAAVTIATTLWIVYGT